MKRQIFAIIEVDWEGYEDVSDELVLEDAIGPKVGGVEIFLDEAMHASYADLKEGEKVVIPLSTLEFVPGGNAIWINGRQGNTTLRIKTHGKINVEQCKSSPDSHADIMLADDINFCISSDAQSVSK